MENKIPIEDRIPEAPMLISATTLLDLLNNPDIVNWIRDVFTVSQGFRIIKDAILGLRTFVSNQRNQKLPLYVEPVNNPDIIVGETNTSKDKTVTGTVESRKVKTKRVSVDPEHVLKFLDTLYGNVVQAEKDMKKESFQPGTKKVPRVPVQENPDTLRTLRQTSYKWRKAKSRKSKGIKI
jgi:hypothetical protein